MKKRSFFTIGNGTAKKPMSVLGVMEIAGKDLGTELGPLGVTHGSGPPTPLQPNATVKLKLVGRAPTDATKEISRLWTKQLMALDAVGDIDQDADAENYKFLEFVGTKAFVNEGWLKSSSDDEEAPADLMCLTTPPLYAKAPGTPQRKRKRVQAAGDDIAGSFQGNDVEMGDGTQSGVMKPGETYVISVLPLHEHPLLANGPKRITQFNFKDIDGAVIPPWALSDNLRPGTLVAFTATPVCYIYPASGKMLNGRKNYMLEVNRLDILAESPKDAEDFSLPGTNVTESPVASSSKGKEKAVNDYDDEDDFDDILATMSSPSKKRHF